MPCHFVGQTQREAPSGKKSWTNPTTSPASMSTPIEIFLLSHKDASRFKVLRTTLSAPISRTRKSPPASEVVITGSSGCRRHTLPAGSGQRHRTPAPLCPTSGGIIQSVKLPFDGTIQSLVTNPTGIGRWLDSFRGPNRRCGTRSIPKTDKLTDTTLVPPSPVDFSQSNPRK